MLMETGEFESSRYRDLPLPLFPAFWRKIHKSFKLGQLPVQRAHDDGILVSPDSPEAFEEIYWQSIGNHLSEEELSESFSYYISSIAAASGPGKRYISKNNNNITRLGVLEKICEKTNGVIIIPVRDPLKTAISSHRMHQRFIALQKEDPFVLEYMNLLGHREFGKGLQWLQIGNAPFKPSYSLQDLSCWLEYWVYIHQRLLKTKPKFIKIINIDMLRQSPEQQIAEIIKQCGINLSPKRFIGMIKCDVFPVVNIKTNVSTDLLGKALVLKREIDSAAKM